MKILVLLPDSPDPWSNTAGRYYGPMLKTLAGMAEVTALGIRRRRDGGDELAYFAGTDLRIRLFDPPPPRPLLERKLRSLWRSGWELAASDFGQAAREEAARDYDAILAEDPATARVVEDDPRTVLSLLYLRHVDLAPCGDGAPDAGLRERVQARRAELSTCRRAAVIRVLSRRLEDLLRTEHVAGRICVIPLCIDPALYAPLPAPAEPTVGVLGSMFWPPSRRAAQHFIERVVPRLRAAQPGVRFLVGGWQAQHYVGARARASGVEIVDSFTNPAEAFARLSVLVYAPPVGTGMKVKVLEAMAYGVPAVVNAEGFEGLEADPHPGALLAHSDDEIVDSVLQLLRDAAVRRTAIEQGRACIERSFSPIVVTRALHGLLGSLRNGTGIK